MPQGLQVYDASGNLTLDVTDRITRYLGSFSIPAQFDQSGSVTVTVTGTPWFLMAGQAIQFDAQYPLIWVDGSVIRWKTAIENDPVNRSVAVGATVHYGVY